MLGEHCVGQALRWASTALTATRYRAGHMEEPDSRSSLDLDALAVSDRFLLFNFTRRDDHVA